MNKIIIFWVATFFLASALPITSAYAEKSNASVSAAPNDFRIKPNFSNRAGAYVLHSNGIVRDTKTGLEWMAGPDRNMTWDEANRWVKNLGVSGGGWRMPTLDELQTLFNEGSGPRNMTPLLRTRGWWVWSGETEGTSEARSFSFGQGYRGWLFRANSSNQRAFAVRLSRNR